MTKEAKFFTHEQVQAMREEMLDQVLTTLDGKPALLNIAVLLEAMMLVAVDYGMEQNKLLDLVSGAAMTYYHQERTEGMMQ